MNMALWRSWLARRPVTAEVASSSLVRVAGCESSHVSNHGMWDDFFDCNHAIRPVGREPGCAFPRSPHREHVQRRTCRCRANRGDLRTREVWTNRHEQPAFAAACSRDRRGQGGFDRDGVDRDFFEGTRWQSLIVVNIGHPGEDAWFDRLPRLAYEDAVHTA